MHKYMHHMKDFNSDTLHLTRVERALYRDAIELYYLQEKPLTSDLSLLCRKLKVTSDERESFEYILLEYFHLVGDVYIHHRCDEEIAFYHGLASKKSLAGIASARSKKKNRLIALGKSEEQAEAILNGEKGNSTGVEQVLNGSSTESQQNPTNQQPTTSNQQPVKELGQNEFDRDEWFDVFWSSGIRKVNKKKAKSLFNNLLKKRPDREAFVTKLVQDIQFRLSVDQLGFTEMHPTTYLNGERWNDERVVVSNVSELSENSFTAKHTDRSWASDILVKGN